MKRMMKHVQYLLALAILALAFVGEFVIMSTSGRNVWWQTVVVGVLFVLVRLHKQQMETKGMILVIMPGDESFIMPETGSGGYRDES